MDYSDLVFDDLVKYPELAAKIFGSSSIDTNLLPKVETKPEPVEQNLVLIKLEPQQKNENKNIQEYSNFNMKEEEVHPIEQLPPIEIKSEPKDNIIQNLGIQPVYFQPFPVIIDSFSILQTGLIFLAPVNVNMLQQSQIGDSSSFLTQLVDNGSQQTQLSPFPEQPVTTNNSENLEAKSISQQSKFKEGSRYKKLSPKQLERIRKQDRIRKQNKRLTKTDEERKVDRLRNNLRQRERRARETDERRAERLNQRLQYKSKETEEERQKRLESERIRMAERRRKESKEQRQKRLETERMRTAQKRSNESAEEREKRLAKLRVKIAENRRAKKSIKED